MSSNTLRLCVAVIILATALSQPRTPTVLIDVFSFIQQILSVPRRDATSTTADVSSEEVSQFIELFSTQASLSSNDPSAQQIAAQRLFPLHKQTLTNVSSACRNDSLELISALLQRKLWAITVADAGFKLPSGVLQGDLNWLGSYSECINVTAQIKGNDQQAELFRAHYCSAMIGSQGPLSSQAVTLGLCVPKACTEVDMQHVLKAALSKVSLGSMTVTMTCLPKSTRFGPSEVILIVFLACLGAALLAGTLYDVIIHQAKLEPATTPLNIDGVDGVTSETTPLMGGQGSKTVTESSRLVKTALALSLYSNGAKVLDASTTREGTLGAIHGMRFISMTWVMLGHVYVFGISSFKNPVILLSYLQRFTFQAIWNATVSVDSFFVMSGTLVSYLLLREMKRSGGPRKINWLHFYLHRYWRLTAPYVLVMAVWIILFPLMGSGPLWATQTMTTMCDSWWRNTLYINNLFPSSQECMGWMWYVANDLQFYLISPLILVPIFWSRIIGVSLIMVLIVVSFIINGVLSYEHQFVAGNAFVVGNQINITQMTEYFDVVYQTPWCRIGPYLVGMLLGYLLYITKGNVRMPRLVVVLGWTLAAVCNLSVLYGLYHMMNGHPISVSLSAFYNSVFRTVWAVGVAWVIFACVTGHGGFVNTLLSWPVLVPLSRLTYMTYLIHPIVYYFFFGTRQQLLMLDDTLLIVLFLGLLVLCYGLSFLLVITIESPMMALEKVFISRASAGGRKHVDGQTDDRKTTENVNC